MLNKLFYCIFYSVNNIIITINKDSWVFYEIYLKFDFYIIYIYLYKRQTTELLIRYINIIQTKYSSKIVFVCLNNKNLLKNK